MNLLLAHPKADALRSLSAFADTSHRYAVDTAANGIEALLSLLQKPYDLVILDTELSILSGLELLRQWRQVDRQTRFVLTGSHPTFDQARQGISLGALDFCPLPDEAETLAALMDKPTQGEDALAPLYAGLLSEEPTLLRLFRSVSDELCQRETEPEVYRTIVCRLYSAIVEGTFAAFPWLHNFVSQAELSSLPANQEPEFCLKRLMDLRHFLLTLHPDTQHPTLHQVFDYILLHVDQAKQTDVATHFFLSTSALSLLFSEHAKLSYNQYLSNLRLTRGAYLLTSSPLLPQQIAETVGYQDYSYFSRRFRQRYGVSPGTFRDQHPTWPILKKIKQQNKE